MLRFACILASFQILTTFSFSLLGQVSMPGPYFYENTLMERLPENADVSSIDTVLVQAGLGFLTPVELVGSGTTNDFLFRLGTLSRLIDRNPVALHDAQDIVATGGFSNTRKRFSLKLFETKTSLQSEADRYRDSLGDALLVAGFSDYVLFGVVQKTDTTLSELNGHQDSMLVVQVRVFDTLKGRVFPPQPEYSNNDTVDKSLFAFTDYIHRGVGIEFTSNCGLNNAFYGYPPCSVGDTVLVFASCSWYHTDEPKPTNLKRTIEPFRYYLSNGGIFVVKNGIIEDEKNHFGLGKRASWQVYIAHVNDAIFALHNRSKPRFE